MSIQELDKFFIVIILVSFLLVSLPGASAGGRVDGEIDSEIWLSPGGTEGIFGKESVVTWDMSYVSGNVEDLPSMVTGALYWPETRLADTGMALSGQAETRLLESRETDLFDLSFDGYFAWEFGPDYPIGTMGGSTRADFGEEELDYWASTGIVNYGGFSYQGIFLLERQPEGEVSEQINKVSKSTHNQVEYNSGLELSLSGTKLSGIGVELIARFGLQPSPLELAGIQDGSGYDTFSGPDQGYERLSGYTGSEVSLEGVKFGPLRFDSTSNFSADSGFEKTTLDFSVGDDEDLLELDGSFQFKPGSKDITLEPELNLEWGCLDVYSELKPDELTEGKNVIEGFAIRGYGMNEVSLGNVKFSFLEALGDNNLIRESEEKDWRLRAEDYGLFDRGRYSYLPGGASVSSKTDYGGVLSLEGGTGNLYLGVDLYWSEKSELFGVSQLTGEAEYRLSNSFDLTTGLVLDSSGGLEDVIINTVYSW